MSLTDDDDDDDDDVGVFEKEKKLLAMGTVSCVSESTTTGFTPCRTNFEFIALLGVASRVVQSTSTSFVR